MTRIRFARRAAAALLMTLALTGAAAARTVQDFAGHWLFKLGDRSFIALDLTADGGTTGPMQGVLTRPRRFQTSDGVAFLRIELPVVRSPLVRSALDGDLLRLTFANPLDAKDEDEFELRLSADGKGSLGLAGAPFAPWPLERVADPAAIATDWVVERTYRADDSDVPSAEMARIFAADQADRPAHGKIDWAVVVKADAARRAATQALLEGGALHTGVDYAKAAFVFQHGDGPDDYLLAHTLALVALAKGNGEATWIAAASLDRYLQAIRKPQVYGTQFLNKSGGRSSQEPYDRALVSDALRRQLGVPSLAEQEKQRKEYESGSR